MKNKAIILAGGSGTRLHPVTLAVSKQLLPVYGKPMVYYPLTTLMSAGVRDFLIITTEQDQPLFYRLLKDGSQWGISFSYAVQDKPNGIAEAFVIGRDFVGQDPVSLILGDNIFWGSGISTQISNGVSEVHTTGATIFTYSVDDPRRYGVVEVDSKGNAVSLEEKPSHPKSNLAITGVYCYDNQVVDLARELTPSPRGELEITDINKMYLNQGLLRVKTFNPDNIWLDMGTTESFHEAGQLVETIEKRTGAVIGSPEAVAFNSGYISAEELYRLGAELGKSQYGQYLMRLANKECSNAV